LSSTQSFRRRVSWSIEAGRAVRRFIRFGYERDLGQPEMRPTPNAVLPAPGLGNQSLRTQLRRRSVRDLLTKKMNIAIGFRL
jgi:hypothetical protein